MKNRTTLIALTLILIAAGILIFVTCRGTSDNTTTTNATTPSTTSSHDGDPSTTDPSDSTTTPANDANTPGDNSSTDPTDQALTPAPTGQTPTAPTPITRPAQVPSPLIDQAETGTLVIGIEFNQPGLSQQQPDGTLTGFTVDVATSIATQLGVPINGITFTQVTPDRRDIAIQNGDADLVIATYPTADPHNPLIDFAGPYISAGNDLLVATDNTDITGPETLGGKTLCYPAGSDAGDRVKNSYTPDVQLEERDTPTACVEALRAGQVDAVTADNLILAGLAAPHPDLRLLNNVFSDQPYNILLSKNDTPGTAAVNAAINHMIETGEWTTDLDTAYTGSNITLPLPPAVG